MAAAQALLCDESPEPTSWATPYPDPVIMKGDALETMIGGREGRKGERGKEGEGDGGRE